MQVRPKLVNVKKCFLKEAQNIKTGSGLKDRRYQSIGVDKIKRHESSRLSLKITLTVSRLPNYCFETYMKEMRIYVCTVKCTA